MLDGAWRASKVLLDYVAHVRHKSEPQRHVLGGVRELWLLFMAGAGFQSDTGDGHGVAPLATISGRG